MTHLKFFMGKEYEFSVLVENYSISLKFVWNLCFSEFFNIGFSILKILCGYCPVKDRVFLKYFFGE